MNESGLRRLSFYLIAEAAGLAYAFTLRNTKAIEGKAGSVLG